MDFIIWFILVMLTIFLFGVQDYLSKPVIKNIFNAVILIIFLAVILSPIYYEFPSLYSKIYIKNEQGIYKYKPYGGFCYEWGDNYKILPDYISTHYYLENKEVYLRNSNYINRINKSVQLQIHSEIIDANKFIKTNPFLKTANDFSEKITMEINKYCQTNEGIIAAQMEFLLQSDNKNYQKNYKKILKSWNKYFAQKNIKITDISATILINY